MYIDDIIMAGDDLLEINHMKQCLDATFKIKDLGTLKFFLGLEIHNTSGICVYQRKYALDILSDTGMIGCKPASTPIDHSSRLSSSGDYYLYAPAYHYLVGHLLYLTTTWPNISFVVQ